MATVPFLDRPSVVVHQNLLVATEAEARGMVRGRLWMWCCEDCGFAFNAAFDPELLSYGSQYENAQTCSPAFREHVDDRVAHLVNQEGVRSGIVVEVGCGEGAFLQRLLTASGDDLVGHGFDPAYGGSDVAMGGRLRFERRLYDAQAADLQADFVVCRHVIEHVADPIALLDMVRAALTRSERARVYFETPCLDWILSQQVLWDFFYEHCSLFTAAALETAFRRSGFSVRSSTHVFGGQYLWLSAQCGDPEDPVRASGAEVAARARAFGRAERARTAAWSERLRAWSAEGCTVLWGAGAKGVTYANLVDAEGKLLSAVIDVNPMKQGHYIPGTGHAIHAPEYLKRHAASYVLVTNPNYVGEIERAIGSLGSRAQVIDITRIK